MSRVIRKCVSCVTRGRGPYSHQIFFRVLLCPRTGGDKNSQRKSACMNATSFYIFHCNMGILSVFDNSYGALFSLSACHHQRLAVDDKFIFGLFEYPKKLDHCVSLFLS